MSILKFHVSGRSENGLLDVTSTLEVLYREVLNLTYGWNLTSANFPSLNFPAIDLHDPARRIAVQVTINCDATKIKKTQKTFTAHKLKGRYDQLIFVGITSVGSTKKLEPWAKIFSQRELLNLENLTLQQLIDLDARLDESIPWHRFVQQSDRHCFDVVLGVLNRDAIRHTTDVEGNFDDMLAGLRQIKQVINQGQISGTPIKAKPLPLYSTLYAGILEEIDVHVGRMSSLVQKNVGKYQILEYSAAQAVDHERIELIARVNNFCDANGHATRISSWSG